LHEFSVVPWQVQIWDGKSVGRDGRARCGIEVMRGGSGQRIFKFLRVRGGFKICGCGSVQKFQPAQDSV